MRTPPRRELHPCYAPPYKSRSGLLTSTLAQRSSSALFAIVTVLVEVSRDRRERAEATAHTTAQRGAIDFRISALAYSTLRNLEAWARQLYGREEDILETIQFWGQMAESAHPTSERAYRGVVEGIMGKWSESGKAQDIAEARLQELQTLAPQGSEDKRDACQNAFVEFYEFAGRLNRQLATDPKKPEWRELVLGLKALDRAIKALERAVDPALLAAGRAEATLPPSLLDQLATALEADLGNQPE